MAITGKSFLVLAAIALFGFRSEVSNAAAYGCQDSRLTTLGCRSDEVETHVGCPGPDFIQRCSRAMASTEPADFQIIQVEAATVGEIDPDIIGDACVLLGRAVSVVGAGRPAAVISTPIGILSENESRCGFDRLEKGMVVELEWVAMNRIWSANVIHAFRRHFGVNYFIRVYESNRPL